MHFELKHTFDAHIDQVTSAMLDPNYGKYLLEHHSLVLEVEPQSQAEEGQVLRRKIRYRTKPVIEKIGPKTVPPEWFAFIEDSSFDKNRYQLNFENVATSSSIRKMLVNRGSVTLVAKSPNLTERITSGELKLALPFLLKPLAVIGERVIYSEASKLLDEEASVLTKWIQDRASA